MNQLEVKISISVESYDEEKSTENYRNCYVAKKIIVSKLSKVSIPNCNGKSVSMNKDCVKISRPYL